MFPVWLHVLRASEKQTCTSALEVWVSTLRTRTRPFWSCCNFSDGPVVHVELVFQVPCGGRAHTCEWRKHAFPSSSEPKCQPGYVHLAAASVVSQAAYSLRVVLDRAFTASSGKYEVIQIPLSAAGFERTVSFIKRCLVWSNKLCNRQLGLRDHLFHENVYHELVDRARSHGCLIDEEADNKTMRCLVKPAAGLLELLSECGAAACENPSATYSTRGYFYNYLPCRTDLAEGFTREMVETGPEPRPMTCSEFLCVSLMLGGLKLEDEEPYEVTPGRLAELCEAMGAGCVIPQPGVCGSDCK